MYNEGQWQRNWFMDGVDSNLHGTRHNKRAVFSNIDRVSVGHVLLPQAEPIYKQTSVSVELVKGGILTNVAWPGAQVNANASGTIPGGVALGIHGLWESPLMGQMVLVGYVEGSNNNPIVINKYPYNASPRPDLETMHFLPMTTKGHGFTDVVLGHHTGSYIALRGTLPVPAEIDIFSFSSVVVTAATYIDMASTAQCTITTGGKFEVSAIGKVVLGAGAGFEASSFGLMDLSSVGNATLKSDAKVSVQGLTAEIKGTTTVTIEGTLSTDIKSNGAPLTLTGVPGVTINSGVRAVAAMGDLTPTLLGPSPIVATGVACLVP